jgi:hypothetical protein
MHSAYACVDGVCLRLVGGIPSLRATYDGVILMPCAFEIIAASSLCAQFVCGLLFGLGMQHFDSFHCEF